jgi:hypothetical protein
MKDNEIGGECSTHWRDEKCIKMSENLKGKIPLGRPKRRLEDNIRMELKSDKYISK